ncbi:MAG: DUF4837 family protein [Marinilabiliales bacterium]
MLKKVLIFFTLAIIVLFTQCSSDEQKIMPGMTGKIGEVVTVVDNPLWQSAIGDTLAALLQSPYPGLPVDEPRFSLVHIPNSALNNIFKTHRNILIINVSSHFEKAQVLINKSVYSDGQLFININAPEQNSCINLLKEQGEYIVEYIEKTERERNISYYTRYKDREIIAKIKQQFNCDIIIPSGYEIAKIKDDDNFMWISTETPLATQGIFIYQYDYTDTNTFTISYLVNKRDEFLKKHVESETPGSYMKTATIYPPDIRAFEHKGDYTCELRGLWEVENDFLGGPFISFSKIDKQRNKVITVEGFVFAPSQDKRNYVRQLEAILYTFDVADN